MIRNPSLRVNLRDGKLLVKCHTGCDQQAVVDALKLDGLWPEENGNGRRPLDDRKGQPSDHSKSIAARM